MTVFRLEPHEQEVVSQIAQLVGKTPHEVINKDLRGSIQEMQSYLESTNPHDIDSIKELWG